MPQVNSPLPVNSTDTIIMLNSLSYVPDAGKTLSSIHAALRPGGLLVMSNELVQDAENCEGYLAAGRQPGGFRENSGEKSIRKIWRSCTPPLDLKVP